MDPKRCSVNKTRWGYVDTGEVLLFTLRNSNGFMAKVTNLGASLTEFHVPDREGCPKDVVLGFPTHSTYATNPPSFGCIVGRVANRIAGASFVLEGRRRYLVGNENGNTLHGGDKGFGTRLWTARERVDDYGASVDLSYTSADGEQGFPGRLDVKVTYTLTSDNCLDITMHATTDQTTVVNLANHTYWNLGGHDSGPVLSHTLQLEAEQVTAANEQQIPTGALVEVRGGPLDFTTPRPIGSQIDTFKQNRATGGGFDHNFVLKPNATPGPLGLRLAATVEDPASGRGMRLFTDQPAVQLYTANWLDGSLPGKHGASYKQHFPDAPNHSHFPSITLRPNQKYRHVMRHVFYTTQKGRSRL